MKTFSYYLVKKQYDEMNKRSTSAAVRTDGPIRINSFGAVVLDKYFYNRQFRVDYYLMYILEGSLNLLLDGEYVEFKAGEFALFPPYTVIDYEKKKEENLVYYLAHFSGTDVERFLDGIGLGSIPAKFSVGMLESVTDEFLSLFDAYAKNTPYIQEIAAASLQKILIELSLKIVEPKKVNAPWNAVYYIQRHLAEKISIPELAKTEGMSESRFYAVFKNQIGSSPIDYINMLRIERACNLLTSAPMSIGEIGENCGFDDVFYFSKIFKKRVGMTPTQYRNSLIK